MFIPPQNFMVSDFARFLNFWLFVPFLAIFDQFYFIKE